MTRLFLRFYLGVILILLLAWQTQGYIFETRRATQNARIVEQALSGGARLARDELMNSAPGTHVESFESVSERFDYPVRVIFENEREMSEVERKRLADGEAILLYGSLIDISLPGTGRLLEFGPLPRFVEPSQTELTLGFGAVFGFAAIAIAILLRPVASQLRAVERAATAIAEGDLSARVDRSRSSLPLANAFNTMADRTESMLHSQRELLQAVSHELRTPLARIHFATDLIRSSKSAEEREKRLDSVDNAAEDLDSLVGELMAYVRMESERPVFEPEPINLTDLVAELAEIHESLHPVRFVIDPDDGPDLVVGDRASLSRAIGNLLSNAGRYAKDEVTINLRTDANDVVIEVQDDGPGIPEADRNRIFEPFVRLDQSDPGGAGLGLALVQRIADRHGGTVSVDAADSGGARFRLSFPRQVEADQTAG